MKYCCCRTQWALWSGRKCCCDARRAPLLQGGLQAEPGLEHSSGPPKPPSAMGRITHSHGGGKLTHPTSPNLSTPETPSQEGSLHKCCNVTPAATPGSHGTSLLKDLTHMVLFVYLTFSTERKKKIPQSQRAKKPKLNKKTLGYLEKACHTRNTAMQWELTFY